MSGSGLESLPDGRDTLQAVPDVREWSGGPFGWPRVVGRSSVMVGRPSLMSGIGRYALPEIRVWSGGPPE